ncbi:hypothetical protein ACFL7E_08120, partial [Thermodesulfobacteriota bacterium]
IGSNKKPCGRLTRDLISIIFFFQLSPLTIPAIVPFFPAFISFIVGFAPFVIICRHYAWPKVESKQYQ